jgi:hypothetical protein
MLTHERRTIRLKPKHGQLLSYYKISPAFEDGSGAWLIFKAVDFKSQNKTKQNKTKQNKTK